MQKFKFLLAMLLIVAGLQVAKAAETVIFEVSLDTLAAKSLSANTPYNILSTNSNPTGMTLFAPASLSSAIAHGAAAKCGSTDRMGLAVNGGYLELPPLDNPATISFTGLYTSPAANRYLCVDKKVGEGNWERVDSFAIINSNSNCTDVVVNVNTAGSVTLRVVHTIAGNTFMIYGGAPIKVTGMDMTAPSLAESNALLPTGTDVVLNASLNLKFDRPISKGVGNIVLYKSSAPGTAVKTIPVATDAGVSIFNDSTLVVDAGFFETNTQYYVLVDNGAIKGSNGVAFAGISNTSDWTFTTKGSASSAKDITAFNITNQDSSEISGTNITVWVKYRSDVTKLKVSTLTTSPAAQVIAPAGWSSDMEVDFTSPVTFTVEAEDQTSQSYTVTVNVNANADATIKSMNLYQGVAKVSTDEINIRTMAVDQQSITSLTINGAEDASIFFNSATYADTVTLTNVDITGMPTVTVTAADGVNSQIYTLVAADVDTAQLPVTAKGQAISGPNSWSDITTGKGWLMDASWHSSLYAAASGRNPIRFMTSGDYIMLHCDSAPEKVSYYLRANALDSYKVLLEESADGTTWTTAKETTADLPVSDFGKVEASLLQTTRFLKWTISNLAGSGSLMFDEVNVTKYIPGLLSSEKDILSFSLLASNGKTYPGAVDKTSSKVSVKVPTGVTLTGAKATFELSAKSAATVGGVSQVSGVTENDFTSGLIYRVTAENNTFLNWDVEIDHLTGPTEGLLQFDFSTGTAKTENYIVAENEVKKLEISAIASQAEYQTCGKRVQIGVGNSITFPMLSNMGYITGGKWGVGTNGQKFVIEKKYEGSGEWLPVDTITTNMGCNTAKTVYINTHSPAQLRIRAHASGTSLYGVFTIHAADMVAPTLASDADALFPIPGSQSITTRLGKLEMNFSENVKAGTGNITIYNKTTGGVVDTAIDVNGAGVNFSGSKITVVISKKFDLNTEYYIQVPAGVILDEGENSFAGITDNTTWTFKTKVSESSDASIFDIILTTPTGTVSVSYGAPMAGAPVVGVTPLAQRVIYKTDPTQLKVASFTLPAGATVKTPSDWNATQIYDLTTTPLNITILAEDDTEAQYSISVSQVEGNHLANISSVRGDYAYARANQNDTSVVLKTVGYNGTYNISNVTITLADSAKITLAAGVDSVNRASLEVLDLNSPKTYTVVSHNGDSTKHWKISAKDIGKAAVPVHFIASTNDLSRVLALTDESGWLPYNMMGEYEVSGSNRPSKMNVPGAYVILALDKVGDSVSYKTRAGSDKNYDFELRESADAINWTSVARHTKTQNPIYATSLLNFKYRLNPSTRYLQWYLHSPGDVDDITQIRLDDIMVTERTTQSSEKRITKFSIDGVNGVVIEAIKQIGITLPAGTDITALEPTIEVSYFATVNPNSGVAQNFTNPVQYTVTAEDGSKQNYTITVTVEDDGEPITAVDKSSRIAFTLYPNPVNNTLFISSDEAIAGVEVFDQNGTLVRAEAASQVDVSALSSGLYFVRVKTADGKYGVKIISKQ